MKNKRKMRSQSTISAEKEFVDKTVEMERKGEKESKGSGTILSFWGRADYDYHVRIGAERGDFLRLKKRLRKTKV